MNEETPTPSRRRGRPRKTILAPPQEPELHTQAVLSVQPDPIQAPTVPSPLTAVEPPLEPVKADDVDMRENPEMAAKHTVHTISGSDSKVRGASDSYLPVEAGTPGLANPALPEQSHGATGTSVEADGQRINLNGPSIRKEPAPFESQVQTVQLNAFPPSWTPVQIGDVVQVNSHRNKHLGTLFIVSDIKNHRVHGYQIGLGGKLDYFTVNEEECIVVGPMARGQIRHRNGCSSKWKADNR